MEEEKKYTIKKRKKWPKVLALSLAAVILVFSIVYAVYRIPGAYTAETAVAAVADRRVELTGMPVRQITAVKKPGKGVVYYQAKDGSRVAKDQVLGCLCSDEEEVRLRRKMDRLASYIDFLKEAPKNAALVNTQYQSLTLQMNTAVADLVKQISAGNFSEIADCERIYVPASARRELAVDGHTEFGKTIELLQAEYDKCKAAVNPKPAVIRAPIAGYFSRGGAVAIKPKDAEHLTVSKLEQAMEQKASDAVGVISPDYVWSFAGIADAEEVGSLKVGADVRLDFGAADGSRLPAVITSVKTNMKTGKLLVQASCDYISREVSGAGSTAIGLILDTYQGIRVSKRALRFENSTPGVYVKGQRTMKFKKTEILYENDSFMICAMNTDDPSFLRLYDEVIVKGADLYDGKAL